MSIREEMEDMRHQRDKAARDELISPFSSPEEDEAWREAEKKINPVWQSPHDAGGVCAYHGTRYAAHEQCHMCVLAGKSVEQYETRSLEDRYPQYYKSVRHLEFVDVYRVHTLFAIEDCSGCLQHASKKLLLGGSRTGGKTKRQDIEEARDTLTRWLEMEQGR